MVRMKAPAPRAAILLAIAVAAGLLWQMVAALAPLSERLREPAAEDGGPFLHAASRPPAPPPAEETPGIRRLDYSEPIDPEFAEFEIEAVDRRGEPIRDALVGLRAARLSAATSTDASGRGKLVARGSAVAAAHAAARGYLPETADVVLRQGERGKLRIVLGDAVRLAVEVEGPDGRPVRNATIRRFAADATDETIDALEQRGGNREGRAVFDVAPGDFGTLQIEAPSLAPEIVPYAAGVESRPTVRASLREGVPVRARLYDAAGALARHHGPLTAITSYGAVLRLQFVEGEALTYLPKDSGLRLATPPADLLVVRRNFDPAEKSRSQHVEWRVVDGRKIPYDPLTDRPLYSPQRGGDDRRPPDFGVDFAAEVELSQTWPVRLLDPDGRPVFDAYLERDPPAGAPVRVSANDQDVFPVPRCGLPASRAFRFRDGAGRVTPWRSAAEPRPAAEIVLRLGA